MGSREIINRGRALLYRTLTSPAGDRVPPLRWTRQALNLVNDLAGRPLCSAKELQRREEEVRAAAEAVAAQERGDGGSGSKRREAAPVILYVTDQDVRTKKRIGDIFRGRDIPFTVNDVTDDEASRSWALTQAQRSEFPLVFIAGEPLGGLDEVMQLDVRGELVKKVFG